MTIKKILVVDDSMSSRLVLRNMLSTYDVEISLFESVQDALNQLKKNQPDAIFLDRFMPGIDGIQALKILKSNPKTAVIPVVMFTSLAPDDDGEALIEQGAMAVLNKPFTSEALQDIMGQLKDAAAGGRLPTTAPMLSRLKVSAERKMIEPLVRKLIDESVKATIEPLIKIEIDRLQRQLDQQKRVSDPKTLTHEVEKRTLAALEPTLSKVTRLITATETAADAEASQAQRLTQEVQEQYQQQMRLFGERLDTLEQQFNDELQRLQQQLAEVGIGDAEPLTGDQGVTPYYMLDNVENFEPIVENQNGGVVQARAAVATATAEAIEVDVTEPDIPDQWKRTAPHEPLGTTHQVATPTAYRRPQHVTPTYINTDPRRRYAIVGVAAAVIAVVALIFLFRSLGA